MPHEGLKDDFYERIKPRLHRQIGCELRLARHVLDLGCGSCDLVRYLAETCRQEVTGVDVVSHGFPKRRRAHEGVPFRGETKAGMIDFGVKAGPSTAKPDVAPNNEAECRIEEPGNV